MKRSISTACVVVFVLGLASSLQAAIEYGDYVGNTVTYEGISEDSTTDAVPLFGAPTINGNSLNFAPVSFGSHSSGAGGIDITDGSLTTMITAHSGHAIGEIVLHEAGDYTMIGLGGADTSAAVSSAVFVTVFGIEGAEDFDPIFFNTNMLFTPSDGDFNLADDGMAIKATIWEGDLTIDVMALLEDAGQEGSPTMVTLTINNTLVTTSEAGTAALIKKKQWGGMTMTVLDPSNQQPVIPEPGSLIIWSLLGGIGIAFGWRRRRQVA